MIQLYAQFWFFIKGSGTSFSTTFGVWFFKENISRISFYWLTKSDSLVAFICWDTGQLCIVIICCPASDVINFEINRSFLINSFFYIIKESERKSKYLKKRFWLEIKSIFHHFERAFIESHKKNFFGKSDLKILWATLSQRRCRTSQNMQKRVRGSFL